MDKKKIQEKTRNVAKFTNIDIITYDELFERAYHMVCLEKIPEGWYGDEKFDVK